MVKKKNNIVGIFNKVEQASKDITKETVNKTIEGLVEDNKKATLLNCITITIDDDNLISYSYANNNKIITMIGSLDILKVALIDQIQTE